MRLSDLFRFSREGSVAERNIPPEPKLRRQHTGKPREPPK